MDFTYLENWALKDLNIDLSAYKSNQLQRRILSLMSRVGVNSLEEYVVLLKKDKQQKQKFLDFITINVTEFFRNPELFDELKERFQKELSNTTKEIKIWSAACSTGAEPYSIAMMLDSLPTNIKFNILATDIDSTILEKAKKGNYLAADIKNVKKEYITKYFTQVDNNFSINSYIKSKVNFKKQDLILDKFDKNFDLIICRNVVIYFNQDVKNEIYKKFSESLNKGGLFFVGATESIYNFKDYGFEKASTFIYRKL
jgi:chemotaxis protein methyltransferase CheR